MAAVMDDQGNAVSELEELTLALLHSRAEVERLGAREQLFSSLLGSLGSLVGSFLGGVSSFGRLVGGNGSVASSSGVGCAFKWGELGALYRTLDQDMKSGKQFRSLRLGGPMVGATFRW